MPKLAVLAPSIGVLSETFIRRHMEDLLPGETVAVADLLEDGTQLAAGNPRLLLGKERQRHWPGAARRARATSMARVAAVTGFLREHRVEVAMGEYLHWSHAWLPAARPAGVRFFAHAHGFDVSKKLRVPEWRDRYLDYNLADGVITVSETTRTRLIDLGIHRAKIHVVPCGVDVPPEPMRRPPRDTIRCLAVGRMVPKKGPCVTLEAFRLAAAQCDRLCLDFIGNGELLPAAQAYVREFNLGSRVRLHGGQSHLAVQRAMQEADVFVQHSRTDPATGDEEGLPVAILEAMAAALPVVSTRHAGIPEAVLHGVTGLLVDEGDAVAMAECLVALSGDPERRATLGREGWRRAASDFSWTRERRDLLRVLGLDTVTSAPSAGGSRAPALSIPGNPLVSVVVPAYNRATTIARCLESIRGQTYTHWEAVVVDDGSTDATAEATAGIAREDGRVRLIRHASRRGAQAARNSGIRAARGEWIAFLDSDDEFLENSLELRLRRAIDERRDVVHSACEARHVDGALTPYHVPRLAGNVYSRLLRHEGPLFPALLVRRTALERIGLLDDRIIAFQEWDTSIRLSRHYDFAFEPQPTFIYDCRGADTISKNLRRNGEAYEQVVRKHFSAMLRNGGPRAMAQHYRRAERWYESAAAADRAARCRRWARLWSCVDPEALWGKMRASLVRG